MLTKYLREGGVERPGLRGAMRALAVGCIAVSSFCVATTASAARTIRSLPHVETFDTNAYNSDITWTSQGGTHTWLPSGGWRGGAAKFTPPTGEGGYSGLGQFMMGMSPVPAQLNVRWLIYYGDTWREHGRGETNKLVIFVRNGNGGRPMIIGRDWQSSGGTWETWGACDGTVCKYQGGDFWPDGSDRLRIGNPPARERQWISVEFEANTSTGMIRLYVDSQDGALSGLYVERPMDDTGPGGVWSYVDIIGGYFNGAATAHAENYYLIDELAIDSRRIGPPAGFVGGAAPAPAAPSNVRVQ